MTRSTLSPLVKKLADDWEKLFKSAQCSGILPDPVHEARGGFHVGRQFNPAGNFSVVRPDDKVGSATDASAIDMSLNPADMRVCTARLLAAFSNTADPRRKYLNAFNGTTDGKSARRWDVYARTVKAATKDHLWHVHVEIRRRYSRSAVAMAAILSILKGESVTEYLRWAAPGSAPQAVKAAVTVPAFPGVLQRDNAQTRPNAGVKLFQSQLRVRGVQVEADGFFGPLMEAATKQWQRHCGLTPDGVVGKVTWPTPWTHG